MKPSLGRAELGPAALAWIAVVTGATGSLLVVRVLSESDYGLIRWIISIGFFGSVILELAGRPLVVKAIASGHQPLGLARTASSFAAMLAIAGLGISLVLYYALRKSEAVIGHSLTLGPLLLFASTLRPLSIFFTLGSEARGRHWPRYTIQSVIDASGIGLLAGAVYAGAIGYAIAGAGIAVLVALIGYRSIPKESSKISNLRTSLRPTPKLIAISFFSAVFISSDIIMIGVLGNTNQLNQLALAAVIGSTILAGFLATAPKAFVLIQQKAQNLAPPSELMWLLFVLTVPPASIAALLIAGRIELMRVAIFAATIQSFRIFHTRLTGPIFHLHGKYGNLVALNFSLAVLNIAGNFMIIPHYGAYGALAVSAAVLALHHLISLYILSNIGEQILWRQFAAAPSTLGICCIVLLI